MGEPDSYRTARQSAGAVRFETQPPGTTCFVAIGRQAALAIFEKGIAYRDFTPATHSNLPAASGTWLITLSSIWIFQLSAGRTERAGRNPLPCRELDPAGLLPERPYTKDELRTYLQ